MNKPFDPTKPVQTRDGRPVRILATDRKSGAYPIVALVRDEDGSEEVYTYSSGGEILRSSKHNTDLVNVPSKIVVEGWLNVYTTAESRARQRPQVWDTRQAADQAADPERVACIKISREVVEGLYEL